MVNQTLTMQNTVNGTSTPAAGAHVYVQGTAVTCTAIPDSVDYALDYWTLDAANVGAANPYNVTMGADHTLKAWFTIRVEGKHRNRVRRRRQK